MKTSMLGLVRRAVESERRDVVAYLRAEAKGNDHSRANELLAVADAIEAGEHEGAADD